ncbi:MAG: MBL fold metallo-hydrolase [Chloroflexi bacterium]|nr:MBL fold metallo-hydrolase [Chloroflexota bacterium]
MTKQNSTNRRIALSRREMLKGLSVGALGLAALPLVNRTANAQAVPSGQDVAAFYRFQIGDFQATVVMDVAFPFDATGLGVNQAPEDVLAFFETVNRPINPDGTLFLTVLSMMLQTGDQTVLFDTGNGPGVGKLAATLGALGVAPEDVDTIIMSHLHPDHIGGLSNEGELIYPNAAVLFPQAEFDFMQNGPEQAVSGAVAKLQPALDADMVTFTGPDEEVIPGVQAVFTPGHTPGHTSFLIESNGSQLMAIIDTMLDADLAIQNPGWHAFFDGDPVAAADTRQAIIDRIVSEQLQVWGYHFPFPGTGFIVESANGPRWVPYAV